MSNANSPNEISVVEYIKQKCCEHEWAVNSGDVIDFAEEWERQYKAAPVPLDKCADAVGKAMGWNNIVTDANGKHVAKAVLEAAGVKYHE